MISHFPLCTPSFGAYDLREDSVVAEVHICSSFLPARGGIPRLSRLWAFVCEFAIDRDYARAMCAMVSYKIQKCHSAKVVTDLYIYSCISTRRFTVLQLDFDIAFAQENQ